MIHHVRRNTKKPYCMTLVDLIYGAISGGAARALRIRLATLRISASVIGAVKSPTDTALRKCTSRLRFSSEPSNALNTQSIFGSMRCFMVNYCRADTGKHPPSVRTLPFGAIVGKQLLRFRFGEANLILSDNDKIIRQLILIMCQQIF